MDDKIHVMQVTFGMGIGGMERVIMDLCRYVNPDRFRFSIVCISVKGPLADQMEEEGVHVTFCEKQNKLSKYLRGYELAKIIKASDVDIIHTHHTPAFVHSTIGALLARHKILINTDHCKNYQTEPKRWIALEYLASHYAREIVAVSDHTRSDLIQHEHIAENKVSVIYNGINVKKNNSKSVKEIKIELGVPENSIVIGSVGRLTPQKGYDLFITAIPLIIDQIPNITFVLVGGGIDEEYLRKMAASLGISNKIIITGWRKDAVDILEIFDVFVSTSRFEGMPMVMLEAMALAKPIIATAVGGVPEVVKDGVNGILLNTREPYELSNAIIELLSNKTKLLDMSRSAASRYKTEFTANVMAKNYEKLYEKHLSLWGRK